MAKACILGEAAVAALPDLPGGEREEVELVGVTGPAELVPEKGEPGKSECRGPVRIDATDVFGESVARESDRGGTIFEPAMENRLNSLISALGELFLLGNKGGKSTDSFLSGLPISDAESTILTGAAIMLVLMGFRGMLCVEPFL